VLVIAGIYSARISGLSLNSIQKEKEPCNPGSIPAICYFAEADLEAVSRPSEFFRLPPLTWCNRSPLISSMINLHLDSTNIKILIPRILTHLMFPQQPPKLHQGRSAHIANNIILPYGPCTIKHDERFRKHATGPANMLVVVIGALSPPSCIVLGDDNIPFSNDLISIYRNFQDGPRAYLRERGSPWTGTQCGARGVAGIPEKTLMVLSRSRPGSVSVQSLPTSNGGPNKR
jgi:hypothetical protein